MILPMTRPASLRRRSSMVRCAVRVASLYLPNGNPAPGPKYDYKLAWMQRLKDFAAGPP
jgi:exonuclease III